jgi:hypothetical protein
MNERGDLLRAQDQIDTRNGVITDLIGQRNELQRKNGGQKEAIRRNEFALHRRNVRIAELEALVAQHEEQAHATLVGYALVVDQREAALAQVRELSKEAS